MSESRTNRPAAWTLVLLTPLVAELALGSTPMSMAWLTILWLPIYGAGVLLIREAVRRTGRGWPSLVVLGVAYELVEDGIGLQALTSPTLYGAAGWGPRLFGFNVPYWEANALYHVLFSVLIPILLVELVFPDHGRAPYLGRFGLVGTGVVAVAGVGILRLAVPPSADPGYVAPLVVPVASGVVALLLAVVALRALPRTRTPHTGPGRVPSPWLLAAIGLLGTVLLLGLLFPVRGTRQPAFTSGNWVLVPMIVALLLAVAGAVLVHQWSRRAGWNRRHVLFLVTGALVGHSAAGTVLFARTPFDRWGLVAVVLLTAALAALLARSDQVGIDVPL